MNKGVESTIKALYNTAPMKTTVGIGGMFVEDMRVQYLTNRNLSKNCIDCNSLMYKDALCIFEAGYFQDHLEESGGQTVNNLVRCPFQTETREVKYYKHEFNRDGSQRINYTADRF